MSKRRLLISLAHPDDESFGLGGLISRYVDEGVEVYLICATNGDAGVVPEGMLNGHKSPSELRLAELDCATSTLGLTEVFTYGYKDSGMMGSTANQDRECLWYGWQNSPEEVTGRVVETIRKVKPQVVITFNRYGAYGHPDHIAIQRATVEAFTLAADGSYVTDGLSPHRPQKLYFNSIPTFMLRIGILMMRLQRKDPRKMGANKDIDLVAILDNTEPVHAKVDIADYLDTWEKANACHASQGGGRGGIVPRWLRRLVRTKQGFTRVIPPPSSDRVDETNLFDGVTLEDPVMEMES